jgi:hypothetical protein
MKDWYKDLVPEAIIVYLLKHYSGYDWACINCQCKGSPVDGNCPGIVGCKWQLHQGETGLDIFGKLKKPLNGKFAALGLPPDAEYMVLEAKGDRVDKKRETVNRPAYNEMTGALCGFLVSNLHLIRSTNIQVFGWVFPTTFEQKNIEDFRHAVNNIKHVIPKGRAFLMGRFNSIQFWQDAPKEIQDAASQWFEGNEGTRNDLLRNTLCKQNSLVTDKLIETLFSFN